MINSRPISRLLRYVSPFFGDIVHGGKRKRRKGILTEEKSLKRKAHREQLLRAARAK